MLRDPEVFTDPMAFKPERYRNDEAEMAKVETVFGFGRRVCPGQYFADGALFSVMATFLATCHILPGLDSTGNEIMPKASFKVGSITYVFEMLLL